MVTKLKIVITNVAGALIKEGEATPDQMRSNQWEYKAAAANPSLAGTTIKAVKPLDNFENCQIHSPLNPLFSIHRFSQNLWKACFNNSRVSHYLP